MSYSAQLAAQRKAQKKVYAVHQKPPLSYDDTLTPNLVETLNAGTDFYTNDPTVAHATGLRMCGNEAELIAKTVLNPRQRPNPMESAGRWIVEEECLLTEMAEAAPR